MSTNFSETPWWAQHQQMMQVTMKSSPRKQTNTTMLFNLNQEDDEDLEINEQLISEEDEVIPKEGLFVKPLTPSDVGKLNRLVIPKQHAEKYFPLSNSSSNSGNDSVEKGLLLSFEDELGKQWKFRYSYWNSSQSYVLTKGWSRFVKEKRLEAGDIVMFERHRVDSDRFFIGWRRRNAPVNRVQDGGGVAQTGTAVDGGGGWTPVYYSGHPYPSHSHGSPQVLPYQPDCFHAGLVNQQNHITTPSRNSRRQLRLFGVNMVCHEDESSEPSTPDGSSTSSQQGQPHQYYQNHSNSNKSHQAYDHQHQIY